MTKARDLANASTALGAVSATELAFVDGVTSAIQTQIDAKIGQSTAINPTIVDAKGDIIAATAADTVARLAVGTNGTVLTAASGQATGLEWATPSSGGMTLISTTSLSGATVTLSSIPQTYVSLYLVMFGLTNATANGVNRIAPNGATSSVNVSGTHNGNAYQRSNTYLELSDGSPTLRTDTNNIYIVTLDNYTSSTNYKNGQSYGNYVQAGPSVNTYNCGYVFKSNTAVTSIVISNDGGNLSTGTALLYGVK